MICIYNHILIFMIYDISFRFRVPPPTHGHGTPLPLWYARCEGVMVPPPPAVVWVARLGPVAVHFR